MKLQRGQMSIEFFLLFVIVVAVFSIFMFLSIEIQRHVTYLTSYNNALAVAMRVGNSVNSVIANNINLSLEIPSGYNISSHQGAIVATEKATNTSASWPIMNVQTFINITGNSTLLNISMQNSTIYING